MCGLVSRLSILFHWAMCLLLCHQPSLFILKLLILFFSVVTVAKLCPSPHVPPRLLPSGKDFIFTEKLRFSGSLLLGFVSPQWPVCLTLPWLPPPASWTGLTFPHLSCRVPPGTPSSGPPRGPSLCCVSALPPGPASAFPACKKVKRGLDSPFKTQKFLPICPHHPPAVLLSPACFLVELLKVPACPALPSPWRWSNRRRRSPCNHSLHLALSRPCLWIQVPHGALTAQPGQELSGQGWHRGTGSACLYPGLSGPLVPSVSFSHLGTELFVMSCCFPLHGTVTRSFTHPLLLSFPSHFSHLPSELSPLCCSD